MANGAYSAGWLTSRRLRAHGLIVGLVLWSIYFWTIATPGLRDRNNNLKGTDFLHFYTLGLLAREHRGTELYDMQAQATLATERVPQAAGIRYLPLYPPQVSILFAPLARLSYGPVLGIWWFACGLIYAFCCYRVWRACPHLRPHGLTVSILAGAFPAFFHLIAWGQTSALALGCFTLMFFCVRDRRDFPAGLALGCLIFKPQLALAAGVVFLTIGAWKILAAAAFSAAAQLFAGILYYGMQPLRDWLWMIGNLRAALPFLEPKPYQTHCLRTFWSMIVPWAGLSFTLYSISAAVVLALTIAVWKRGDAVSLRLRFPALLFATVLVAPHLTVYDLVILAPAILLLADWLIETEPASNTMPMGTALYCIYMLPLLGPLARWTHVQLSVIAMEAVVYLIWRQEATTPLSIDDSSVADPRPAQVK